MSVIPKFSGRGQIQQHYLFETYSSTIKEFESNIWHKLVEHSIFLGISQQLKNKNTSGNDKHDQPIQGDFTSN